MDGHEKKRDLRVILTWAFAGISVFLIALLAYKHNNTYAYPGLEDRVLLILAPVGMALLYLYLDDEETWRRISGAGGLAGMLRKSRCWRFCEDVWQRAPPSIRARASDGAGVLSVYLRRMGWHLVKEPEKIVSYAFLGLLLVVAVGSVVSLPSLEWAKTLLMVVTVTPLMVAVVALGVGTFYLNRGVLYAYLLRMRRHLLEDPRRFISYAFLGLLLLVAVQSIAPESMPGWTVLDSVRTPLMAATVVAGVVTFYLNRGVLEDVEEEARQEGIEERKRGAEFAEKYPRVNRVWGVRWVARWGYKEGWWYSTAVISLLIIGFSIRLYGLGELSLWWDELITGTVVTRIRETGLPLQPSGLEYYWRGVAYHYFVVMFTYLFGLTEFAIRFPSVLFGMGIVFLSFLVGKKIDKWVGLLVLLFMTFSTYNIEYSRFARFYVMNAFLFMLSIFFVYEGFFKGRMKYKITSLILFLIMMHTVQLGRFFMFVIGGYFGYELIRFVISRGKVEVVKQNKFNFVFLGFSLIILQLGNLFQRFFSIHVVRAYEVVDTVAAPAPYPIIQFPDWAFFKFIDSAHIPLIFIFIFLLFSLFTLLKNIKDDNNRFLTYVSIVFVISVISFEFLNRGITGARICLIFEGLYVIFSIYIIYIILRIYNKQKKILKVVSLSFVVLLLVLITPNFYERVNINYGDDVSKDPFRTTHVAAYRADYKTQYLYLNGYIAEEAIWINVKDSPYFYINKIPTYVLNQNYRWNTYALLDETGDFRTGEGSILINKVDDIKKIIENNPNKKVWLVVNGGSVNILTTTHTREDFLRFLKENENKTIYQSPDKYSRVLLFT